MSTLVTEEIVREVGDAFYTVKVDGTRDPTGTENVSIVICFVDDNFEVKERLLSVTMAAHGDTATITETIIAELTKAGLTTDRILSQRYDGAAVMSGKHGGVQKLLQDRLGRNIPYTHCFNNKLHLVVVHALSTESEIQDFFGVCDLLYKFIRKPTVAVHYKGEKLKRQRWTGHLDTVCVILKSLGDIRSLLVDVSNDRAYSTDIRFEATGLVRSVTEPNFSFIAVMVHKILKLLEPANKMLQAENTDLLSANKFVNFAADCVQKLRSEDEFNELWRMSCNLVPAETRPNKRQHTMSKKLEHYSVEETVGQHESCDETELRRLYFSAVEWLQMTARFGECNGKLIQALTALDPAGESFLDKTKLKPLLDLTGAELVDSENAVAKKCFAQ